ncbi:hypothetical protein T484DRAFT_1773766 [Baffinella frigidus]|nr:hypothetical protein T484DRAFT_1773766 [Cryptophyta sp. CCMP2293]
MAAWATPDALLKLLSDNFDDEGRLKEESTMMARGTFAVVFKGDTIPGGDAQCVVRVTVIPPGDNQELAFDKELQALIAYLKLMKGESSGAPVRDQFVEIRREDQPAGLCRTDAYYIVTTEGRRVVFTVMPLGIPLMNIIEDQLVLASEGGQQERDLGSVLAGMSQLATALKMMHGKAVYWRDCKMRLDPYLRRALRVDNVVFVGENAEIIDINSGVCTVGYASHEQLVKLPLERFDDSQAITDALERVLLDQPDHQTWETQDVFALSISNGLLCSILG